ncbi:MAG: hypothetical protein RLZZ299_2900 [Pseudomonadota bacterium]
MLHGPVVLSLLVACTPEGPTAATQDAPVYRVAAAGAAESAIAARVSPDTRGALDLRLVAPSGPVDGPVQVVAMFDRPMVALGALEDMHAAVPVRCTPDMGLRPRWAGTSAAVLEPSERFPRATEVRCVVPRGTRALDGSTLDEDVAWSFQTPAPRVTLDTRGSGWDSEASVDPAATLVVHVDQPTTLAAIREVLTLVEEPSGGAVPFTVRAAPREDGGERDDSFLVDPELRFDRSYALTARAGLVGREGPLGSAEDVTARFRTPGPLAASWAVEDGLAPIAFPPLLFSEEVDPADVSSRLTVEPRPPGGWQVSGSGASRAVHVDTRLAPRTRYTVTLAPGVRDRFGQVLTTPRRWTFTTGDEARFVDGPEGVRFYVAGQPTRVPVRFRNVPGAMLELRALPLRPWMEARSRGEEAEQAWLASQPWTARALGGSGVDNRVHVAWMEFGDLLRGGRGVVTSRLRPDAGAEGGTPPSATPPPDASEDVPAEGVLVVTDLAATVKQGASGMLVWVTTLSDGTPVRAAEVEVLYGGRTLWRGASGRDGTATVPAAVLADRDVPDARLVVLVRRGDDLTYTDVRQDSLPTWNLPVDAWGPEASFPRVAHAFADRGVYRPGERAHVALTLREARPEGLRAPAPDRVPWTLTGPDGEAVAQGEVRTNDHGNAQLDVALPAQATPGDWAVQLGDVAWVPLPVAAYRVPTFRVDVSAPDAVRVGGTLRAAVSARYLHGAAMRGVPARWSSWSTPYALAPDGWDGWSFEEPWDPAREDDGYGDSGGEHDTRGNGAAEVRDGELVVEQPLRADLWTRPSEAWIEVSVEDVDGQQITGRSRTVVHVADAYAAVRAASSVGEAGRPFSLDLAVVRPDGTGAGGRVHVLVTRTRWDNVREKAMDGTWRWVSSPRTEVETEADVRVASRGTSWGFTPSRAGTYRILVTPRDAGGRAAGPPSGVVAWVAGEGAAWARSDTHVLDLVPDRAHYEPGDVARVLVRTPRPGMHALVTIERDGVVEHEVRRLASTAETLRIPVRRDWQPNVFVGVVAVDAAGAPEGPEAGRPGAWFGAARLAVSSADRHLGVTLRPKATEYRPGDEVELDVIATREGRPLRGGQVQAWAVDAGVLSLTGYAVPDPFATFYAMRPLRVRTADNRSDLYDRARALAKGAPVGGGGGAQGMDPRRNFITTPFWSGLVATDSGGRARLRFRLPDNLTTFRLMAVVDDGAAAFGAGEAELRVRRPLIVRPALPRFVRPGDSFRGGVVVHNDTEAPVVARVEAAVTGATVTGAPATVEVPAGGAREVSFGMSADVEGRVAYRFSASTADGALRDSVEGTLPVLDARPEERVGSAGTTTGEARETVVPPRDAVPNRGGLDVRVAATALVGVAGSVEELLAYPWSCVEQTGSRIRARLAALTAGDRFRAGMDVDALRHGVIDELGGLARFRSYEGYAYWPGQDVDGVATAYVLEVLREARDAGFAVDDRAWEPAVEGTRRWILGASWDEEEQARAAADLPRRIRGVLALHRAGHSDAAVVNRLWERRRGMSRAQSAMLLELLGDDVRGRALLTGLEGAVGVGTSSALVQPDGGSERWFGAETPTTAFLRALLAVRSDHPLLPRLAGGLVGARRGGRWTNTWTTAESLRALVDYAARFDGGPVRARVTYGPAKLIDLGLGRTGQAQASVPLDGLGAAELRVTSEGGGRLYYDSTLRWTPRVPTAREEGFSVARRYEVLEGDAGPNAARAGAMLRVTLTVVTPKEHQDVLLVDPLPAGFEPIDQGFATAPTPHGELDVDAEWVFDRREVHDDRVAWFAETLPAGVHVLSYRVRATRAGDYTLPPAEVSAMYDPTAYARGAFSRFDVRERSAP